MKNKRMIISIGRECGCGEHEIGQKLAAYFGIRLYDRNILDLDSGLYTGTFEDGRTATILREKGSGFSIIRPARKGWFEKADFDENGGLEGVSYEK